MRLMYGAIAWAAAGCSPNDAPTFYEDVQPVLDGRCVSCHQPGGLGSPSLTTFDESSVWGVAIAASVQSGRMPPWPAKSGHQLYQGDRTLTDDQIQTIVDWVEGGMPEGDPEAVGEPLPSLGVDLPRVDHLLEIPEPYYPVATPDDYRCFLLEWDATETRFITGYEAHPGNSSMVHHVTAFLIRPDTLLGEEVFDTLASWEAESDEPGYQCFGGPSGSEDLGIPVQQLGNWVPGGGALVFPEGTGIEVPVGSKVVLQTHYNLLSADGLPDQTSLAMMSTDSVERKAGFAPWLDITWVMGGMDITAGSSSVSYTHLGSPFGFFDFILGGDLDLSEGFEIYSAMLHMHLLGESGSAIIHRSDGGEEVLLEVPDWDFDWQLDYRFEEPVRFGVDDELEVTCTWDNSGGSQDVSWGEGSTEEMCVANLFIVEPKR